MFLTSGPVRMAITRGADGPQSQPATSMLPTGGGKTDNVEDHGQKGCPEDPS